MYVEGWDGAAYDRWLESVYDVDFSDECTGDCSDCRNEDCESNESDEEDE